QSRSFHNYRYHPKILKKCRNNSISYKCFYWRQLIYEILTKDGCHHLFCNGDSFLIHGNQNRWGDHLECTHCAVDGFCHICTSNFHTACLYTLSSVNEK